MRAERRLTKLEASLPPREAVRHWLGEVHGHGTLAANLDRPTVVSPLVELTERAEAAARHAHAGEPLPVRREAERRATADTCFLVLLVVEVEEATAESIRLGSLRLSALRWEYRARSAEGGRDRPGWSAWRRGVLELATTLSRTETVRHAVAERYLDGVEVLSPVVLAAWVVLQDGVTALVETLPTTPGGRRRRRSDLVAIRAAAERDAPDEATRLLERVRARTLDLLGDHVGTLVLVERVLRDGKGDVESELPRYLSTGERL